MHLFRIENSYFDDGYLILAENQEQALTIADETVLEKLRNYVVYSSVQQTFAENLIENKEARHSHYTIEDLGSVEQKGIINEYYSGT